MKKLKQVQKKLVKKAVNADYRKVNLYYIEGGNPKCSGNSTCSCNGKCPC